MNIQIVFHIDIDLRVLFISYLIVHNSEWLIFCNRDKYDRNAHF